MKTNPNEQVFPCLSTVVEDRNRLTKREYFAAMALQGLLVNENGLGYAVVDAVRAADLLIAQLNKEGQ